MLKQFIEGLPRNQLWAIADLYNWYNAEHPGLSCRKFTRQLCGMTGCKLQHPRIDGKQAASIYLSDGELKDPPLPPDTRYCPRCRETKLLTEFFNKPGYCRKCHREYTRSYYRAYISPRRKKPE